jgi:surfeit locus 1 family protein
MTRKVPFVPTVIVLLAAAIMVALGFWQLGRADEKEALLARYAAAGSNAEPVAWPRDEAAAEASLYRRSQLDCEKVSVIDEVAGTAASGEKGWAHRAHCATAAGDGEVLVDIGWSRTPDPVAWAGGPVQGVIAPGPRLVADPAVAGLEPLAKPDPNDLPNNHLSYAVQWFLFAATALVIYVLALRRRWRDRS